MSGDLPAGTDVAVTDYIATLIAEPKTVATRKASQMALEVLTPQVPAMIGGSADLTGSNNTNTAVTLPMNRDDYGGRYIYYGVRGHAMAAAMIPRGATQEMNRRSRTERSEPSVESQTPSGRTINTNVATTARPASPSPTTCS